MTDSIRASAPGKLVLLGEYAVVYSAPALVAAMPRRASVTLTARSDPRWVVSTPGLSDAVHNFDDQHAPSLADNLPLLRAALDETGFDGPGQDVELNTEEFFAPAGPSGATPHKLGLGSSAALCVGLVAALCAGSRSRASEPVSLAMALAAHRSFQGGRGSGIDVAASFSGGVIRFQRKPSSEGAVAVSKVTLPASGAWFWSGSGADTRTRLGRLERFRSDCPETFADLMGALAAASQSACAAAQQNAADAFLASAAEFTARLADLDEQAGLGVWTKAHHELAALARTFGLLYKTSGAGGGDCGIALHPDAERLTAFREAAAARGFPSWSLAADNTGLALE